MKTIAASGPVPQSVADRSAHAAAFSPQVQQRAITTIRATRQHDAQSLWERARTMLVLGLLNSFIRNITGGRVFARRSHPMVETQAG